MKRTSRVAIGMGLVLTLILAACGGSSDDSADPVDTTTPPEVVTGGTATVVQPADAATLDPTTLVNAPSTAALLGNALYDALYTISPEGDFQPRIATDFSSDDGITWTMTLRDDVTFSDGTPFDAAAVKAQWEELQTNVRASARSYFEAIASMEVIDATTFRVVLTSPNHYFDNVATTLTAVWIPSPTAKAAEGDNFGNEPVGAGPFVLKSRTPGAETVLERNPTYWQEGLPKLDTLVVQAVREPQQQADAVFTGAAQAGVNMSDAAAVSAMDEDGYTVLGVDQIGGVPWLFNSQHAPFDDIRARKAVYLALDMEALDDTVTGGVTEVPTHFFPESSPFHNPDLAFPEPDPEEAQRLFDELAAEGNTVSFTITTPGGITTEKATAVQTQLAAFENVQVETRVVDASNYGLTLFTGDFDLAPYGVGGIDPEPQVESLRSDWSVPIASLGSAVIDQAVADGREATSLEDRKAAYDRFAAELNEIYKFKWMNRDRGWAVQGPDVSGMVLYGMGSPLVDSFGRIG